MPRAWLRRVFRNSFTRNGRSYTLKAWSFKIQFQGRRRTFSLAGRTRAEAAREAQQLYETIRRQGWEAALALHRARRLRPAAMPAAPLATAAPGDALEEWQRRLIHRRYREARLGVQAEYSVRIEHDGAYSYFPLGSEDPQLAAAKAREIYQTVRAHGWPAVFERFEREITLAIFWSDNPAAATYATLFTFLRAPLPAGALPPGSDGPPKPLVVLEPDPTTHACLHYWLERQPGFTCAGVYRHANELLDALEHKPPALVLLNRTAPDTKDLTGRLAARWPALPAFPYRIHEDSDQIWTSVSGVSGGYLYRRRLPTALLDPLQPATRGPITSAEASRRIRHYFQSFFTNAGEARPPVGPVSLTNREEEILNCISRGYQDKEIACLLNISIWTVHNHVKSIYDKLGVHNRTEAALKYLQR